MSTLRNSVRLYGNVGQEPEVKTLESGNKVAKFSLATTERRKDQKGHWVDETTWHNLTLYGKQVDTLEKYVNKGDRLTIEGRISNRTYEGKDGTKKYYSEIIVSDFLLSGSPKNHPEGSKESGENLPF